MFPTRHYRWFWLTLCVSVWLFPTIRSACAEKLPEAAICRLGEPGTEDRTRAVAAVTFSPDNRLAATRSSDQIVRIWNPKTGELVRALPESPGIVKDFVFSHDGKHLALAVDSNLAGELHTIWSVDTGKPVPSPPLPPTYLVRRSRKPGVLSFVTQASVIQRSISDPSAVLENRGILNPGGRATPISMSSDAQTVVARRAIGTGVRGGNKNAVTLSPLDGGRPSVFPDFDKEIRAARYSPNGEDVVVVCRGDHRVFFRKAFRTDYGSNLAAHRKEVQAITFSPDGLHLVTISVDGQMKIWEMAVKRVLGECQDIDGRRIISATFSPSGRMLATGSSGPTDNSAIVWDWRRLLLSSIKPLEHKDAWVDLGAGDPKRAYSAIRELVDSDSTLDVFEAKFGTAGKVLSREEIAKLIAKLGDAAYETRQMAHDQLQAVRITAAEQLRAAIEATDSVESQIRLTRLLEHTEEASSTSRADSRQLVRAVLVMELIGNAKSREMLQAIGKSHPFDSVRSAAAAAAKRLASL